MFLDSIRAIERQLDITVIYIKSVCLDSPSYIIRGTSSVEVAPVRKVSDLKVNWEFGGRGIVFEHLEALLSEVLRAQLHRAVGESAGIQTAIIRAENGSGGSLNSDSCCLRDRYLFEVGDAAEAICRVVRQADVEKAGILLSDKLVQVVLGGPHHHKLRATQDGLR